MSEKPSFLPSDEIIYERSKDWANFMTRMVTLEDHRSFLIDELPSDISDEDEIDSEGDENSPVNNYQQIARINNFEGSSSDEEFDINNLLNETLPIIAERKRKWKESGMDMVLDTFDVNAITEKVGSWLKMTKLQNCLTANSSTEDAQIVHFENHQILFNSDESVKSANIAKHALSNKKPRTASCTTMTIKRIRYGRGKAGDLERKYDFLDKVGVKHHISEVLGSRCTDHLAFGELNVLSQTRKHNTGELSAMKAANPKSETGQRQAIRQRKKRSDVSRARPLSISSSSLSSPVSPISPKLRKVHRKCVKKIKGQTKINLMELSSTDCELIETKDIPPVVSSIVKTKPNVNTHEVQTRQEYSDETGFIPENIVNSTALCGIETKQNSNSHLCQLSPIEKKNISKNCKIPHRVQEDKSKKLCAENDSKSLDIEPVGTQNTINQMCESSVSKSLDSNRKVLVYTPKDNLLYGENISGGNFKLTKDHLEKVIGKKALRRFVTFNPQKLPLEIDSESTVFFKLATESENSHMSSGSSDEDVLEMFGKQGELIEQITHVP